MPTATVSSDVCQNLSLVAKNTLSSYGVRYVGTWSMMGRIPLDGTSERSTTPADHISTKFMYQSGFWGTDAELMAASALLQTDICVANSFYKTPESIVRELRWSLIRPSNNNNKTHAIYIDNYNNKHYQPVTKMIDSLTPTFFEPDTTSTIIL